MTPDVLYTGGFAPDFDFSGNAVQDLSDEPPLSLLTTTVLPSENGGMAILGWETHSDSVCRRFAESLRSLPQEDLGSAIVRLGFAHVENTFARPSWWQSISSGAREALMRRIKSGADPDVPLTADGLMNDGHRYVNWPVRGLTMN